MPNCKHGEFDLREGCPQCIAERQAAPQLQEIPPEKPYIVKVRYFVGEAGYSGREYAYFSNYSLVIGDVVKVPTQHGITRAKVTSIDVPESEIEAFRDKIKTISSESVVEAEGGFTLDDSIVDPEQAFGKPIEVTEELLEETKPRSFDPLVEAGMIPREGTAVVNIRPLSDITIKDLYAEATYILERSEHLLIEIPEDLTFANDNLVLIAKIKKALEDKKKEYIKPLQDYTRNIREAFDSILEPILEADQITREKVMSYQSEQSRKKREADEIRRAQEEITKRAEAIGQAVEPVTVPVVDEVAKRTTTEFGATGQRLIWKWELVDFNLVPNHYKELNNGAITAAVKAAKGSMEIPGLRIFQDAVLTVETGR